MDVNGHRRMIDGVLIDFDGVICPDSIVENTDFLTGYFEQFLSIDREFILSFIKIVAPFPTRASIQFLFDSLGLSEQLDHFFSEYDRFERSTENFSIAQDFAPFLDFLTAHKLDYRIFSLASTHRFHNLDPFVLDKIYPLTGRSKVDKNTYEDLIRSLGIDVSRWLYLDDNPFALYVAGKSGLKTAFMETRVYGDREFPLFHKNVDLSVGSFDELRTKIVTHFFHGPE